MGWQSGAGEAYYPKSASNTRAAGVDLGFVMTNIKNNGGSAASRIHCVGHSLGSHLCGHAGRASSIGRITGKTLKVFFQSVCSLININFIILVCDITINLLFFFAICLILET